MVEKEKLQQQQFSSLLENFEDVGELNFENFFIILITTQQQQQQLRLWTVLVSLSYRRASVLDEPVDVMLGPVFRRWHLEHESDAEKGLLCVAICYHLEEKGQF